jgi:adenylate cyclase
MDSAPERRLSAILAADVVGFSRLMGADESGTLALLKACRADAIDPHIASHRGRIFKTTGDGVLVEFSSAVQAVECAVAVQRAMELRNGDLPAGKRLDLRVGINLSDVIADGDDVFGDGVNIAARLEGLSEPGGICLSRSVYEQVKGKVGLAFGDLGPRQLKNIASPVDVYRVELGERRTPATEASPAPAADIQPSIAVLPFQCLAEDRMLELIADGMVDDIVTLLARLSGFFVISRSSSAAYKNRSPDIRKVGRELGVRYVVDGSIRGSASRVRVSVQLLEAETGKNLWAQRFDVDRGDTLELQDEIAAGVMAELEPALNKAEVAVIRRQRPEMVGAWSHYRQAIGVLVAKGWTEEALAETIGGLKQAIALQPEFALPMAHLALLVALGANTSLLDATEDDLREAQEAAERAIALDPSSSEVLGFAGCALADMGQARRGREILERAIELNPSNAQARVALGATQVMERELEVGIANMRMGMRQSPRDSRLAFWGAALANVLAATGRLEEALAEATAACRRDDRLPGPRVVAAIALARLDRAAEARAALAEARRIRPALSLSEIRKFFGRRAAEGLVPVWD